MAYNAELMIVHSSDSKSYLCDIVDIKEDKPTSHALLDQENRRSAHEGPTKGLASDDKLPQRSQHDNIQSGKNQDSSFTSQEQEHRYKRRGHARGLHEKFTEFSHEHGYWKLLIDRKMINHLTGNIIDQQAVQPKFSGEAIMKIMKNEVKFFRATNPDAIAAERVVMDMFERGEITKSAESDADIANEVLKTEMMGMGLAVQQTLEEERGKAQLSARERTFEQSLDADSIIAQNKQAADGMLSALNNWTGGNKSVAEVTALLGDTMTETMRKYLHNTYEKGTNRRTKAPVTKQALEDFIRDDAVLVARNAHKIADGLAQYKGGSIVIEDLGQTYESKGLGMGELSRKIIKETGNTATNARTGETVRISRSSYDESLSWAV